MMICLMTVALLTSACKSKKQSEIATEPEKSEMQRNVEEFAYFDLKSDLIAGLSDNDKKLLSIFIDIADIMDDLFWKQTFGDKNILDTISDPYTKDYAMIHYGPSWLAMARDLSVLATTRKILPKRILTLSKTKTKTAFIPSSVATTTAH